MKMNLNTTEIICIKNDLKLIHEELILYGFNIKLKEIKKLYFLNNCNIVEVIYYFLNFKNTTNNPVTVRPTTTQIGSSCRIYFDEVEIIKY